MKKTVVCICLLIGACCLPALSAVIEAPAEFASENGFLGLKCDLVCKLLKKLPRDQVRTVVGMCLEHKQYLQHKPSRDLVTAPGSVVRCLERLDDVCDFELRIPGYSASKIRNRLPLILNYLAEKHTMLSPLVRPVTNFVKNLLDTPAGATCRFRSMHQDLTRERFAEYLDTLEIIDGRVNLTVLEVQLLPKYGLCRYLYDLKQFATNQAMRQSLRGNHPASQSSAVYTVDP